MIIKAFTFGLSITVISWTAGMLLTVFLRNTAYYKRSSLNFIKSGALNKAIGLGVFKWIVKNTFFKYLNQKLQLKGSTGISRLQELRNEMTFSEISHLIGFVFVAVFAVIKLMDGLYLHAAAGMLMNIPLNLYPSLLQQQNKRQIDNMVRRYSRGIPPGP
ncbi:MAG: hypothetical protein IBJ09_09620 [Bacteroidia bacterium]|nr:hypothetical protein [Bacteroidia bacterium]